MFRLKFIFFLLIAHQLQSQELYFSSFQPFQNLPSLETYNTFQDSKGFIWVCTDAGLHRYNGKTLTTYTTEEGIPENVVLRAYEDKKGRIWFSTLSGYFFYYQDNEFHSITANKFLKKYFRSQSPDAFFIGENDTLFCGPKSIQGILKIAPQNNYTKIIMFRNCIPSANRILINNKLNPGETIMGSGGTYATLVDSSYGLFWNNVYIKAPLSLSITPDGNSWIGICNKTGDIAYIPSSKELLVIQKNTLEKKRYFFSKEYIRKETLFFFQLNC